MADVSALTKNFFPTPQEGFTGTIAQPVTAGAATVYLDSLAGYINGAVATLAVDPGTSKQQVFTGVVDTAAVRLTSVVWTEGSNVNHAVGATVVDYVTATDAAQISKGLLQALDQQGNLKFHFNVKTYGAIGDGTTNDATAIQAAITAAGAAGGGIVFFPAGTYSIAAGLTMSTSNVALLGEGQTASTIKLAAATNATMITMSGTGTINLRIENLKLDGNRTNQSGTSHGIYVNTPYSTIDCQHILQNLDIWDTHDNGIYIETSTRVVRLFHNRVKHARGDGYLMSGTDHQMVNCIADNADCNGFSFYGTNINAVGCKAFFCDSSHAGFAGFFIQGNRNFFDACEAQDNYEHGFVLTASINSTLTNCIADSNGQNAAGAGDGLYINNATYNAICGGQFVDRAANPFPQKYGIELAGTSSHNNITGVVIKGNATGTYSDGSSGTNWFRFNHTDVEVNDVDAVATATGTGPLLQAKGTDTNIDLHVSTKGTGQIKFWSGAKARVLGVFSNVASSVNYPLFSPSSTTNGVKIAADGTDSNISLQLNGKGTGNVEMGGDSTGAVLSVRKFNVMSNTATPAGGTAGAGIQFGTTSNLGIFFGSGAPTLSAAQGALYIRTDGSSTSTRLYVNTNGTTGWTNVTTAT